MKKITIKVLPRSSRNEVVGKMSDGTLKVKLLAPPVDGKANEALIKLLSEYFNIPKSKIKIVRGLTSRKKTVRLSS